MKIEFEGYLKDRMQNGIVATRLAPWARIQASRHRTSPAPMAQTEDAPCLGPRKLPALEFCYRNPTSQTNRADQTEPRPWNLAPPDCFAGIRASSTTGNASTAAMTKAKL